LKQLWQATGTKRRRAIVLVVATTLYLIGVFFAFIAVHIFF
jgi:hypothetical protein